MPTTAKLAIALLPLMACGAPSTATSPPATSEPPPFAAPQRPAHAATVGRDPADGADSVGAGMVGAATPGPDARLVDTSPRTSDLGQAVAASFPAAIERLGSPARIHVHVEGIDAPMPGQAVVVFLGVEFGTRSPTPVRRVAVPTLWDGERWDVGTPWDLPPPPTARSGDDLLGATLPADDPELLALAVRALESAGWDTVVIESLRVPIEGWAHPVTFEANSSTGSGGRLRHVVWLRRHLDQFVVAGTRVPTTAARTSTQEQDPA